MSSFPSVLTHEAFWGILEESGSINETRGMERIKFTSANGVLNTFSKTNSYGEYIFDWAWADAYQRSGLSYYPKLTSMVPFTPATAPHFMAPSSEWSELLIQHEVRLQRHSSAHFLFTTSEENHFLVEHGYLLRDSFQYHFFNENYVSFEDFLSKLKSRKAKNIRNERGIDGVSIERLTGKALNAELADEMYDFYLMTLEDKRAIPYLTREFYRLMFQKMSENVLYVRAIKDEQALAGAVYYYDQTRLYGRYWGSNKFVPNLHFELCYYQGIEFCIEKKIKVFEAGAQGEHKIARGFRPVLTSSAHKLLHPGFSKLISEYIESERRKIRRAMTELEGWLPFK